MSSSATGMLAYSQLQQREFELAEKDGYSAVKHQRFVGTGYFDQVATTIASGNHLHMRSAWLYGRGAVRRPLRSLIPMQELQRRIVHGRGAV